MPVTWNDYRSVSICNCTHKLLSKLLNARLAGFLPLFIYENQSGFLKGRLISDNILLTQEITQALYVKTKNSNLILKLDMMKAYDKLS